VQPLTVQGVATYSYPKMVYGSPAITRTFQETAINYLTPMLAERGEKRMSDGHMEYLFSRFEETARVDLICQAHEYAQLRWAVRDWLGRGKQFQFWIDRYTGSCWSFDDTLRDQNELLLSLSAGSAVYADTTAPGRGIVLTTGQYLSVALAQASAGTKTGFDDPLDIAEGTTVVDFKPAFASSDSTLHVILDTSGSVNRLQLRKTAANTLFFEITDAAAGVKSMSGAVTWAANDRVHIMATRSTVGVLTLAYAVNGGAFTALTTGAGAGTGLLTALPTTLYIAATNAAATPALGTYDTVAFFKKAFPTPTITLKDYLPVWRNYFPYAEHQAAFQPERVTASRAIWRWPVLLRNGTT
jgi:hypothetical protein